jgi:hypothetical protein
MPYRKLFGLICSLAAAACLAVGFIHTRQAVWVAGVVVALAAWLVVWFLKKPLHWLPYLALLLTLGFSVAGLFAGAAPDLMLAGAALALASWDLALLGLALREAASAGLSPYEKRHLTSLTLALGAGLLVALLGCRLHTHLSFGWMLALAAATFFFLGRVWRALVG